MKKYDDEYMAAETILPATVVDLLHAQGSHAEEAVSEACLLDEHELAMLS